tara:strand:- start:2639 stop:4381 length:1743 start_codon:yes stop_codon:yes gene_type:complete
MTKVVCLFLTAVIFSSNVYAEQTYYGKTLVQADKLRSSSPSESSALLETIEVKQLSATNLELYQYLLFYNLSIQGKLEEAAKGFKALTSPEVSLNIKQRARASLVTMYAGTGKWALGLEAMDKLLEDLETMPHGPALEQAYSSIVLFYGWLGEDELSLKYAENIIFNPDVTPRTTCIASMFRLSAMLNINVAKLSNSDFDATIQRCSNANESIVVYSTYYYMAKYLFKTDRVQEAIELLNFHLKETEAIGYKTMAAAYYELLAKYYLHIKEFETAELNAIKIIQSKDEHHNDDSINIAYEVLAQVKENKKQYDEALDYYKKFSEAKQLKLDQDNAKLLAIQKAKFDDVEKNAHFALLDKENTLLKTQALLDSKSAQNKRLALALLTMALVVFVLWTYKNRRNYLRMQHYAQTDELTGIANRHYFTQQANTAIKYCKRTDQAVSFIMFDLDYFKRINDSYGHKAGDVALKIAVDAVKLACRKNDILGRLGGEEFGILLPGCANHLASFIAEKCRKAIEHADFTYSGHDLDVTASFGIADSSNCEYNFEKLFAGADFALYQSKDMGRNRVVQYQKETSNFDI